MTREHACAELEIFFLRKSTARTRNPRVSVMNGCRRMAARLSTPRVMLQGLVFSLLAAAQPEPACNMRARCRATMFEEGDGDGGSSCDWLSKGLEPVLEALTRDVRRALTTTHTHDSPPINHHPQTTADHSPSTRPSSTPTHHPPQPGTGGG